MFSVRGSSGVFANGPVTPLIPVQHNTNPSSKNTDEVHLSDVQIVFKSQQFRDKWCVQTSKYHRISYFLKILSQHWCTFTGADSGSRTGLPSSGKFKKEHFDYRTDEVKYKLISKS